MIASISPHPPEAPSWCAPVMVFDLASAPRLILFSLSLSIPRQLSTATEKLRTRYIGYPYKLSISCLKWTCHGLINLLFRFLPSLSLFLLFRHPLHFPATVFSLWYIHLPLLHPSLSRWLYLLLLRENRSRHATSHRQTSKHTCSQTHMLPNTPVPSLQCQKRRDSSLLRLILPAIFSIPFLSLILIKMDHPLSFPCLYSLPVSLTFTQHLTRLCSFPSSEIKAETLHPHCLFPVALLPPRRLSEEWSELAACALLSCWLPSPLQFDSLPHHCACFKLAVTSLYNADSTLVGDSRPLPPPANTPFVP